MAETSDSSRSSGRLRDFLPYLVIAVVVVGGVFFWAVHPDGGGLVTYKWMANQNAVHSQLRLYVFPQTGFSLRNFSAVPGNSSPELGNNAYADNYRNLYYGRTEQGDPLRLISKDVADAFLVDNPLGGAPTPSEAPGTAEPYNGYYFQEDVSGAVPASAYKTKYAFMAFPAVYGETGYKVFWTDQEGVVFSHDPKLPTGTPAAEIARLFLPATPPGGNPSIRWRRER